MGDILIEAGKNAGGVLPATLAVSVTVLLVALGFGIKIWGEGETWQKTLAVAAGAISVFALLGLGPAVSAAKEECERVWQEDGQLAFMVAKCGAVSECDDEVGPVPTLFESGPCGPPGTLLEFP